MGSGLLSRIHYSEVLRPTQLLNVRRSLSRSYYHLHCVCVRCPTGVQSQEELLLSLRNCVSSAEQPHPPAEEDVAGHRQVEILREIFFYFFSTTYLLLLTSVRLIVGQPAALITFRRAFTDPCWLVQDCRSGVIFFFRCKNAHMHV